MFSKAIKVLDKPMVWAVVLLIVAGIVSAQGLLQPLKAFVPGGLLYTHYNNYIIFKQSFFHLAQGKDLYQLYPVEQWDYYKYSPTFAFLMAPLALLPDAIGLSVWNLMNAFILFVALWTLPVESGKKGWMMLAFVLIELITSIQNSQSNALIAGLIILAYTAMEKKQLALASLLIVGTVFIKLFGIVALLLFIFYPGRAKAVLYTIGWVVVLAALPLIVIPVAALNFLYQNWLHLLQNDHSVSWGFSVAGWLYTWFDIDWKNYTVLTGTVLLCLPLIRYKQYSNLLFRLYFLSSVLIWMVIFNHKAESPTFIIAVTGVAIWFFSQPVKVENVVLIVLVGIFTILSPTDIFPRNIRDTYITPYAIKAVSCIFVWFRITYNLLTMREGTVMVASANTSPVGLH